MLVRSNVCNEGETTPDEYIYEYLQVFTYSFNHEKFSIAYPSSLKKTGREEDKISIVARVAIRERRICGVPRFFIELVSFISCE